MFQPILCFSQQAETIDIGTCDQSVPKAFTDKGTTSLKYMKHSVNTFLISFICHHAYASFFSMIADEGTNGYMGQRYYSSSADMGSTNEEGRKLFSSLN